jgi:hypothetical protein
MAIINTQARSNAGAGFPVGDAAPPARWLALAAFCLTGLFLTSLTFTRNRTRTFTRRAAFAVFALAMPIALLISCSDRPKRGTTVGTPVGTTAVSLRATATTGNDTHSAAVMLTVE